MTLGEYGLGLLVLFGTWGGSLAAAGLVVARRLPRLSGAPRAVGFALLALAALVLVHLLPGIAGILSRWTALAASLALAAAVWRLVPAAPGARSDDTLPARAESGPVSWGIAAAGVAAAVVFGLAEARSAIRFPSTDVDSLTFHLPGIARWIQSGSLWQLDQFVPLQAHGAYPGNGNLVFLSVVEPFRSDAFVRLLGIVFVVLAGLAAYAIGRELRAPRATAVLAAAVVASLPIVAAQAWAGAGTDSIALAAFGGGVLFTLRHVRLGRTADLVLAGVGLGLAFGTKWYMVSSVGVVVIAWVVAMLIARRPPRSIARGGAILAGLIAVCGGFWFLRNAVETSSPLFPLSLPPLWDAPRDYIRDCLGFSVAHYATDGRAIGDFLFPAWRVTLGLGGGLLLAGGLAAGVIGALRRDLAVALAAGLAVALAAVYVVTPYTALGPEGDPLVAAANARYLGPALVVAAPLTAWAIGRLGRLRVVGEAVLLVGLADALRRAYEVPARDVATSAVALVAAGAAVYGLYLVRARLPRRRLVLPVAAALVLAAIALVGYERQRAFHTDRYADGDPVVAKLVERAPAGHRIALAGQASTTGLIPVWPAFGESMDNRVEYLGRFADGQLREYDDADSWRRALARGRYDLVLVGRGGYPTGCVVPGRESDDDAFARAAGLRPIAADRRLTLYAVPPAMIGDR